VILYYFKPESYGSEYFVMANSKEEAIQSVKNLLNQKAKDDVERGTWDKIEDTNSYDELQGLLKEHTIKEYKQGQVVTSEIC